MNFHPFFFKPYDILSNHLSSTARNIQIEELSRILLIYQILQKNEDQIHLEKQSLAPSSGEMCELMLAINYLVHAFQRQVALVVTSLTRANFQFCMQSNIPVAWEVLRLNIAILSIDQNKLLCISWYVTLQRTTI